MFISESGQIKNVEELRIETNFENSDFSKKVI